VVNAPFFRRLTLRSATGTAQRAVPTACFRQRHNPRNDTLINHLARRLLNKFMAAIGIAACIKDKRGY
jgi:hypothetical protein